MRLMIAVLAVLLCGGTVHAGLTQHALNATYGCRRSFGHGVYDAAANRTAICWNGEGMSVYVREFDHGARRWSPTVRARELDYSGTWDYHNYPCLVLAPDGHYLVFYCRHSSAAYMLRSPRPHTVAGTWTQTRVSDDKCAYPMPAVVGDTVYLFYSSNVVHGYRPYRMIRSSDSGRTWSEPVTLIDSEHRQEEGYDEVYVHGFSIDEGTAGRPERILIGWEMASGPLGHNRGGYGNFFAYFNCRDGQMYTAGGESLGSTVDLEEMYGRCIINDAKSPDSRLFRYTTLPQVLPDGKPGVLYRLNDATYIARWDGNGWHTNPLQVRGTIRDYQRTGDGKYRILASGRRTASVWESSDGVRGWRRLSLTELPAGNGWTSAAMAFIEDFRPGVQWMATTYDRRQAKSDYSGKWPVYTFGVSAEGEGPQGARPN